MHDTHLLTDLTHWLPELITLEQGRGGLRSPRSGRGGGDHRGLPFGVVVDNPDEPADARTAAGIMLWATQWAECFEPWYGRSLGDSLTYLASIADQAASVHPDEWEALSVELARHHARAAALTGHTDTIDEDRACPACGGTLTRHPTERGLSDWRTCTDCDAWWPDGHIIDATRTHTLATTEAEVWATREQACTLHPGLSRGLLRKWVHDGDVDTHPRDRGRVNLAQVNTLYATRKHRLAA
ncbi:hypothetical protein [Actinomyces urogenitalis]|uniref:hypothetical protein n=1 Tax=Actinomyces urogenitalis TaxID=103621 RepID=UPI00189801A5|nr:hypothetical protein [Actinomyces urogenitalis]